MSEYLERKKQQVIDSAKAIMATADAENRQLSKSETETIESLLKHGREVKSELGLRTSVDEFGGIVGQVVGDMRTVAGVLAAKGWTLGQRVSIPAPVAAGFRQKALIDNADNASPDREAGILPEFDDSRFVYAHLPTKDAGPATSIQFLKSSGRTLDASVADLTSTAAKPVTSSSTTLVTEAMRRAATVSDFYANSIVELPDFKSLVQADLVEAYRDAIDEEVVSVLQTEAGTVAEPGTDLLQKLRKASTAIAGNGFRADLALVSPADAEELDLMRAGGSAAGDGEFLLPPAPRKEAFGPLWGMEIIAAANITDPIVLDRSAVQLYIGSASFDADSTTRFNTNESRFRLESPVLAVAKQPDGIVWVHTVI